nr:MAG TPA: hypothetical protein [Caudoviricetes sp.]
MLYNKVVSFIGVFETLQVLARAIGNIFLSPYFIAIS